MIAFSCGMIFNFLPKIPIFFRYILKAILANLPVLPVTGLPVLQSLYLTRKLRRKCAKKVNVECDTNENYKDGFSQFFLLRAKL
jgi:hypothetical protein